ncbi:MAG: VCBS repeat-containing protein [Myxococcales bacterium]|nr:VCBS repeat-containing protein [Myxococcales bacterium]
MAFGPSLQLTAPTPATLVATGDLDSDGNGGVIASTTSTLVWFRNLGSGFSAAQIIGAQGASSFVVADINNDGRRDVLAMANSFATLTPWTNVSGASAAGRLRLPGGVARAPGAHGPG